MNRLISRIYDNSKLETLVENKQTFGTNEVELHLYETQTKASNGECDAAGSHIPVCYSGVKKCLDAKMQQTYACACAP